LRCPRSDLALGGVWGSVRTAHETLEDPCLIGELQWETTTVHYLRVQLYLTEIALLDGKVLRTLGVDTLFGDSSYFCGKETKLNAANAGAIK
ncbi:hypothetical protein NDU88_003153, partial [Pleurodeles waltl]